MSRDRAIALAAELDREFASQDARGRLLALRRAVKGRIVFTTSFGLEDQVLTHLIAESGADFEFATLDTGRLFPETYEVWSATEDRYGLHVRAYYPERDAIEALVAKQGVNGFYDSIDARKACCGVRKVEPLARTLHGADGWIAGLRADQSANRGEAHFVEFDAGRNLLKFNPLLDWTRAQAADFAAAHDVPVNALHAKGFLSIGCAPCTRAVQPGEPERAGRWWWEDEAKKECGLHITADGRVARGPAPQLEVAS
ncbi:phosphoadenylyl-sulfate reductase [Terrarubrum flagellatum]|uniref:phosphoadenylyl-sulfate reductase n=1 Tax=Terrirubrum flagellatum TaxID=2895980 RepID=UPI003144E67A